MAAAIAEIEELIKVQGVGEGDALQVGGAGGKSGGENPPPPPKAEAAAAEAGLDFCCKYCDRKFSNKQGLGGHQNAHKTERAIEKNKKRNSRRGGFMDYGFLHPHYLCSSPLTGFPSLPGGSSAAGQANHSHQAAAANPPIFLPGNSVPSPEIPPGGMPPYAYPFPSAVPETTPLPAIRPPPVENHSPVAQFSPAAPAMANNFPGGSVPANSPGVNPNIRLAGSIVINSNPINAPEIDEDGGLDLTLRL